MSTATEIAEREAAAAEAEQNDDPDEAEAEAEAEREREAEAEREREAEQSSLKVIEEQRKAEKSESTRHANVLKKITGEHWAMFAECPLCQLDGYAMPYEPGEIGPEQRAAILAVMGEAPGQGLKDHPSEIRCEVCDGFGEMVNGSRRAEQATSACQTCMGTGHVAKPVPVAANGFQAAPAPLPPYVPPFDPTAVNHDQWGRDMANPRYGQDPASNGGLW